MGLGPPTGGLNVVSGHLHALGNLVRALSKGLCPASSEAKVT